MYCTVQLQSMVTNSSVSTQLQLKPESTLSWLCSGSVSLAPHTSASLHQSETSMRSRDQLPTNHSSPALRPRLPRLELLVAHTLQQDGPALVRDVTTWSNNENI